MERCLDTWDAQNLAECASYYDYPVIQVGVGEVRQIDDPVALETTLAVQPWAKSTSRTMSAAQVGRSVVGG